MESPYIPIKFKHPSPSKEEQEAVQPFVDFLEDLRKGNVQNMHKHVFPSGHCTRIRPSRIIQGTWTELIETLSKPIFDTRAEPLYDVEVWVDGNIAVAWTPYDFFRTRDGETKLTHRGTDIVFLAKLEGQWKMSGLADNCRVVGPDGKAPAKYKGPAEQDPKEEKAVQNVYQQFIDTLADHEYEVIRSVSLPEMIFANHRGNEVCFLGVDELVKMCHVLYDGKNVKTELLDINIRLDHDLAMIWCQFRTVAGDDVTVGSDIFTFAKVDGSWKITGLGDNYG